MIIFIILGIAVLFVIIKIFNASKKEINLSTEVEKIGAKEGLFASHVEGLGIGPIECKIFRFDDKILIDTSSHKFEIPVDRIRAAVAFTEQELIEKNKSVVGRALIGTLLVPGLGTIVGGMSGIGTKKKDGKKNHYMVLNYIDSKGELAAVTFQDQVKFIMNKFCTNLTKSIPVSTDVIQL
jgi:hypothetical protein